jgi:hypothetical protein
MNTGNALLVGWNKAESGKEKRALEHFMDFHGYLEGLKKAGTITGWHDVLLNPHGGDMNGFVLITGEPAKLSELQRNEAWLAHVVRGSINMTNFGVATATTGDGALELLQLWAKHI